MAKGLTVKQRSILEHIIDFQKENGFPPTIRELGDAFGIGSLRGVTVHLDALERKGFMTRQRSSRSIRITAPDPRATEGLRTSATILWLPLLEMVGDRVPAPVSPPVSEPIPSEGEEFGEVKAGDEANAEAVEIVEPKPEFLTNLHKGRHIAVPSDLLPSTGTSDLSNAFVVQVDVQGVVGDPILPGDFVVAVPIQPQVVVADQLIVVLSQGAIQVCRAEGGDENALGRIIALIRRYPENTARY